MMIVTGYWFDDEVMMVLAVCVCVCVCVCV